MSKIKVIRTATVSVSIKYLLKGQLKFLNSFFDIIAVSDDSDKALKSIAVNEQIRTIKVPMKRNISLVNDCLSLIKLIILFRKERPNIVHSITPKAGLLSMLAAKLTGVPIRMHTFTGLIFPEKSGLLQKVLISMDKLLCWSATSIYPEGQGVRDDLIKFRITKKKLKIIANGNINGVDLEYFNPKHISKTDQNNLKIKLGITKNEFVWIFVGRLVRDKGINELVEAFTQLSYPSKLLLVGGFELDLDPLDKETNDMIHSHSSIISVGFQEDIRPYLAISDCFVFPSYREGFPNVLLQAGCFNLPSIVTNINGSNEIIIDGYNGVIISRKNIVGLKNAMISIYSNPVMRVSLSQNARKHIVSKFTQDLVWNEILKEYQNQLKNIE